MDVFNFFVFKGFLEPRVEKEEDKFVIAFCAVASPERMYSLDVAALAGGIDTSLNREQFLQQMGEHGSALATSEQHSRAVLLTSQYIKEKKLMTQGAKAGSGKGMEGALVTFASKNLTLRAVAVVKAEQMSAEEAAAAAADTADEKQAEDERSKEARDKLAQSMYENASSFICQPVLDPIKGVPMSSLQVGDKVVIKAPTDPEFHRLCQPLMGADYTGTLVGQVIEISTTGMVNGMVRILIAEGVIGVMSMSGSMRIRVQSQGGDEPEVTEQPATGGGMVFFAFAAAALVIAAILIYMLLS